MEDEIKENFSSLSKWIKYSNPWTSETIRKAQNLKEEAKTKIYLKNGRYVNILNKKLGLAPRQR
jgi:hypothetical protein